MFKYNCKTVSSDFAVLSLRLEKLEQKHARYFLFNGSYIEGWNDKAKDLNNRLFRYVGALHQFASLVNKQVEEFIKELDQLEEMLTTTA